MRNADYTLEYTLPVSRSSWWNGVSAYGAECIPRWNWPIPFKEVSITGLFASTDAFDPLALVPLGMSPVASFYCFTCLPFYPPPFGPTSRVRWVWRFTGPHSAASLAEQWEAKLPAFQFRFSSSLFFLLGTSILAKRLSVGIGNHLSLGWPPHPVTKRHVEKAPTLTPFDCWIDRPVRPSVCPSSRLVGTWILGPGSGLQ